MLKRVNSGVFPPPYPPAFPLNPPPADSRRGGRVVGAALLVGALAGGAAGFGGAALLNDSSSNAASSNPNSSLSVGPSLKVPASKGSTESAAAEVLPSVVKIYATSSTESDSGSGIILTSQGEILTNNHVVEVVALNGGKLAVSFNNGAMTRATIIGRDPLTDLAVIRAHGVSNLRPATLGDSDSLRVGQQVVAVGAPFGLESTVTSGIVSALDRPVTTQGEVGNQATIFPAIQTDAAINPGNSGGPLVDEAGQVVGINSAIRTASQGAAGQGGSIGLGFSIPINDAIPIVRELLHHQKPTHAKIGVKVSDATGRIGLPAGALVVRVQRHTAADAVGLHPGDVVTKIDDMLTPDADSLVAGVRSYRPGDTVNLTVVASSGAQRTVKLTLGSDA